MKIEMPRPEAVAAAGRHRNFAGQQPVLIAEDLQRPRFFRLAGGGVMTARDQDRQPVVEADADLMRVNAGVDRLALCDLGAGRGVRVDAVDLEAARVAEGDQQVVRGNVAGHMDRPGRQRDRSPVRRERAGGAIDAQSADMVLVADKTANARGAVARCDIEVIPRGVRPGVMDIGGQADRAAAGQGRVVDINIVMRQLRPDTGIEPHAFQASLSPLGWLVEHKPRDGVSEELSALDWSTQKPLPPCGTGARNWPQTAALPARPLRRTP